MLGRTNALVQPLVSSVNGMTGTVIVDANIDYDPSGTYDTDTVGKFLQTTITEQQIQSLFE